MTHHTFTRRTALGMMGAALVAPAAARAATAYPTKAISFICAFPAGGTADILVRYMTEAVAKVSGHTVIVENKPGAAGNIAAQYTSRSNPDGHTVLIHAGSSIAANMWLFKDPPIDVAKDLDTVATINQQAFMIAVKADSPYKTIDDLVADQKTKGDKGSYAFGATAGKVMAEQFKNLAGIDTLAVQYKQSADILNDVNGGLVDFTAADPVQALSQAREGRWRVLAIASAERMQGAPDVPTFRELGYDVDQPVWWGAMLPVGVPRDVVSTINGWFREALSDQKVVDFLRAQGGDAYISTPEDAQKLMVDTVAKWKGLVEIAKIEPQ